MLDALPYPAYAATNGWTVVAWNRAARLVFADYEALSGRERNIVWMAFTDPDHRRMAVNWEEQARSALALFPSEHGAGTSARSGTSGSWRTSPSAAPSSAPGGPSHDVRGSHAGPKLYDHPIAGRMAFEPMTLRYEDDAMLWVMIKVPVADTDTPAKLARLLAESPEMVTPSFERIREATGKPQS